MYNYSAWISHISGMFPGYVRTNCDRGRRGFIVNDVYQRSFCDDTFWTVSRVSIPCITAQATFHFILSRWFYNGSELDAARDFEKEICHTIFLIKTHILINWIVRQLEGSKATLHDKWIGK